MLTTDQARLRAGIVLKGSADESHAAAEKPAQVLKYQKAAVQRVIVGWQVITSALIQRRYNGDGDPKYAEKLDHVLRVLRTAKVAPCTP